MLIQNKQTKKQYPTTRAKWDALPDKHKALFNVLDETDPVSSAAQKITNTAKKNEQKNTTPKPNTGEKQGSGEKNSTHKDNKK